MGKDCSREVSKMRRLRLVGRRSRLWGGKAGKEVSLGAA